MTYEKYCMGISFQTVIWNLYLINPEAEMVNVQMLIFAVLNNLMQRCMVE